VLNRRASRLRLLFERVAEKPYKRRATSP